MGIYDDADFGKGNLGFIAGTMIITCNKTKT